MKTAKPLRINLNICIKIFLLLGFATFFIMTVIRGTVSLYVHPRIIPYLIFSSLVMIMMAFLYLGELLKTRIKTRSWPLIFFIIPLVMAFSLPAQSFDSSTSAVGDVNLSDGGGLTSASTGQTTAGPEEEDEAEQEIEEAWEAPGIETQNGVIVMDRENFYYYLNDIYANLKAYQSMPIEVVGFVFKDNEGFAPNEFVPARLLMVCCAADMVPVGFLCRYAQATELEADNWVKVEGTLVSSEFEGETIPCIEAESVEQITEPEDNYIYPY